MRRRHSSDKGDCLKEEQETLLRSAEGEKGSQRQIPNQINRGLAIISVTLLSICIFLTLGLVHMIRRHGLDFNFQASPPNVVEQRQQILHEDPENPSVFHDLTKFEIERINDYLYKKSGLDLVEPSHNKLNVSFVFTMELYLPNKTEVLNYLDNHERKPPREATVVIFRGRGHNPEINEIIVTPLPNPTSHRPVPGRPKSIPYFYRPVTAQDYEVAMNYVTNQVHDKLSELLIDAYGASLKNCHDKCLAFRYLSQFSPVSSGANERKVWYWLNYFVEFYLLNPTDFALLVRTSSNKFDIERIWFNGKKYTSLDDLATKFYKKQLKYESRKFPEENRNLFSSLNQRGTPPAFSDRRDPLQFYPDGPRYEIKHRHVTYMDWSFHFRLSTTRGPEVYDIKFRDERIVYELGLQEISVYYSGHRPHQRFSDYLDSSELMGPSARGLIPGIDCPEHATFVSAHHVRESSKQPEDTLTAFCVFEWNTGEPIRRHYSKSSFDSAIYEGMPNSMLILRTALKIANYDYIVDVRFYQNAVLEVKAISTGFILANTFSPEEESFAFKVHDYTAGNYHLHLFHFKVDIDINGRNNRYGTLDITTITEPNEFSVDPKATYTQGRFDMSLKKTERDATFKYNFDHPKYHLFYNNDVKNTYGNPRSYRLYADGFVKQILPEGVNQEPSVSWSRHQLAVTRHKETERHSSSMYAMYDTLDPIVNFTSFISDDECIVDQDLVTWVTMGMHHIPHTEDLPQVTTPGLGRSFYLMPFNYFIEDPAMTSTNALRIEPKIKNDPKSGIRVERYGKSANVDTCRLVKTTFFDDITKNPTLMFTDD